MSIKNTLKDIIIYNINKVYPDLNIENINIKTSNNRKNGDYYSDIALIIGKETNKDPVIIAKTIINTIDQNNIIEKISISEETFLNIYLKKEYLLEQINNIIEKNKNYGRNNIGNNKKVNISFCSFNTSEQLSIKEGRSVTYGDNLARIMSFCGYNVTKECYIRDSKDQNNISNNIISQQSFDSSLNNIKKDLDTYRIYYDIYTKEQSLYDKYLIEDIITKLRYTNYCYIKDDSIWLKTTAYKDKEDRLLIDKDGNYTILSTNIAYHIDKINKNYDLLIDILDDENKDYIIPLQASLQILNQNPNILDIKLLKKVKLIKNNKELDEEILKKTYLTNLIENIGVNATRYFFTTYNINNDMYFDLDLSQKKIKENPIYYIEEANCIISDILRRKRKIIHKINKYHTLKSEISYNIINKLISFEDTIKEACNKKSPHLIAYYVYELASLFYKFHETEPIIIDDEEYTNERLNLLLSIKIVLNNSFELIGIIPREEI